jgi:hypothetical protein
VPGQDRSDYKTIRSGGNNGATPVALVEELSNKCRTPGARIIDLKNDVSNARDNITPNQGEKYRRNRFCMTTTGVEIVKIKGLVEKSSETPMKQYTIVTPTCTREVAQSREHLFKHCKHWRKPQNALWQAVKQASGRGKSNTSMKDLFGDRRCSDGVIQFLRSTEVGRRFRERGLEEDDPGG